MVYNLYAYNPDGDYDGDYDEFVLTDDNGKILYFPSEETAVSFAEKYKSNFLYDDYANYEIDVDSENMDYTEKEAEVLIKFLLDR